jgi:hypothetical protein
MMGERRHEFDYPYPFDASEVDRAARQRQAQQTLETVRDNADLVVRALGDPGSRTVPEWGTDVRAAVIVQLREDFPDFEARCRAIFIDRTFRTTFPLMRNPRIISALERAATVINQARRKQR